jgi:hypothetical protein
MTDKSTTKRMKGNHREVAPLEPVEDGIRLGPAMAAFRGKSLAVLSRVSENSAANEKRRLMKDGRHSTRLCKRSD